MPRIMIFVQFQTYSGVREFATLAECAEFIDVFLTGCPRASIERVA